MKPAIALYARALWQVWLFPCLLALAACGGGGSDSAVSAPQAALTAASSIEVNAPIEPALRATTTYDVVVLEARPPVATGATASAESINATGQVAFTSFRADGRHALFYDGQALQDLGPGYAAAVNNAGQVAGGTDSTVTSPAHALRWTTAGRIPAAVVDLGAPADGTSQAEAINEAGQVAGSTSHMINGRLQSFPFLWTEGVGRINLGTLEVPRFSPGGLKESLNALGQVAGSALIEPTQALHAYFWTPPSSIRDLGTLGGGNSAARALNEKGQIAGIAEIESGRIARNHAFLWSAAQGMQDLGTLGGRNSDAFALNGSGQVAGVSDTALIDPFTSSANPLPHAFYWSPSGPTPSRMLDLGTLGGLTSFAFAINDSGQVVGKAATDLANPNASHAFVWTAAEGLVDLNTRIPTAPAGLTLTEAIAISQNGSVLARTFGGLVLLKPSGDRFANAKLSIVSPPGAYRQYPGLTGRASFNAAIRSERAGQKPTGQMRFHLARAGLRFESTGYDWLNVQANRAQFQGSGTLNDADGYKFSVTLIDGARDDVKNDAEVGDDDNDRGNASHKNHTASAANRLRIRIWHADASQGANVVDYDNQLDASTEGTANEGTAVKSGNVAVHVHRQAGKEREQHARH
jgi:probable HAF family extracellular repeat protein